MGIIYDKSIRKFKNNENTIFEILKKPNNHYYLTEKKEKDSAARIIKNTKLSIFYILMEEYRRTGLKDI